MIKVKRPFIAEVLVSSAFKAADRAWPGDVLTWTFEWNYRNWEAQVLDTKGGLRLVAISSSDFISRYSWGKSAWGFRIGPYYFQQTLGPQKAAYDIEALAPNSTPMLEPRFYPHELNIIKPNRRDQDGWRRWIENK